MTIHKVKLEKGVWTDIYAYTGIAPGTALILDAYNEEVDLSDELVAPPIEAIGFPMGVPRRTNSSRIVAGAAGAWGRPTDILSPALLTVQIGT
jgi:hypothetical protein